MKRTARYILRFCAISLVVVALFVLLAPASPAPSLYVSALVNVIAGSDAVAAPFCNLTVCDPTTNTCVVSRNYGCIVFHRGYATYSCRF